MKFIDRIRETQITRNARRPRAANIPLHRRLFPIERTPDEIARAAVREVLG